MTHRPNKNQHTASNKIVILKISEKAHNFCFVATKTGLNNRNVERRGTEIHFKSLNVFLCNELYLLVTERV